MWYSGSLQKFITALWAIRCAELFVESHRQHNGKYIFVPLPFYGDFAGMVRDNRVRNGQTEPKMTVIRACFVCAEKTFKQAVTDFFRNRIAGIFHGQIKFTVMDMGVNFYTSVFRGIA